MKFCLLTNIISPHQVPLALELAKLLGEGQFKYVAVDPEPSERYELGWRIDMRPTWLLQKGRSLSEDMEIDQWLQNADVVLSGRRDIKLFETRAKRGLVNLYMSERWLKPPVGMWRLLHPVFFVMAMQFVRQLWSKKTLYLPIGIHAATDMARISGLLSGDVRCLFREPKVCFYEHKPLAEAGLDCKKWGPGGMVTMYLWGYFVAPAMLTFAQKVTKRSENNSCMRILWAGRMVKIKRVDTLVAAVKQLVQEGKTIQLKLVGLGVEEAQLKTMAGGLVQQGVVSFEKSVAVAQVRRFMRDSDIYVFPSTGYEGWGAVVNEAMEEGCAVVASRECGAGITLIRHGENGLLFSSGSVRELVNCLRQLYDDTDRRLQMVRGGMETVQTLWNPFVAAERLLAMCASIEAVRDTPVNNE